MAKKDQLGANRKIQGQFASTRKNAIAEYAPERWNAMQEELARQQQAQRDYERSIKQLAMNELRMAAQEPIGDRNNPDLYQSRTKYSTRPQSTPRSTFDPSKVKFDPAQIAEMGKTQRIGNTKQEEKKYDYSNVDYEKWVNPNSDVRMSSATPEEMMKYDNTGVRQQDLSVAEKARELLNSINRGTFSPSNTYRFADGIQLRRTGSGGNTFMGQRMSSASQGYEESYMAADRNQRRASIAAAQNDPNNPLNLAEQFIANNPAEENGFTGKYKEYDAYVQMTNEQKAVYNYVYATYGPQQAEEYKDGLMDMLNARVGQEMYNTQIRDANALEKALASYSQGVNSGLKGVANLPAAFLELDNRQAASPEEYAASYIRTDPNNNNVESVLYDLASSTGNMTPGMIAGALGAPQLVGNAIFGASQAGNAYNQALQNGNTTRQASLYATQQFVDEQLTNYLLGGVNAFGGGMLQRVVGEGPVGQAINNAINRVAKTESGRRILRSVAQMLGDAAGEAQQEYLQFFTDNFTQALLGMRDENGNLVQMNTNLADPDALYSAALGALNALFLNMPNTATRMLNGRNADVSNARELADSLKDISADDFTGKESFKQAQEVQRIAEEIAEKQENGETITAAEKIAFSEAVNDMMAIGSETDEESGEEKVEEVETNYWTEKEAAEAEKKNKAALKAFEQAENVRLPQDVADQMINSYTRGDAHQYMQAYKRMYVAGENDVDFETAMRSPLARTYLNSEQLHQAYAAGVARANLDKGVLLKPGTARKGGLTYADENATSAQRKVAQWAGDKTGFSIDIRSDAGEGDIDFENKVIRINPKSKNFNQTLAHELTHLLRRYDNDGYNKYTKLVVQALMDSRNVSYDQLYKQYETEYGKTGTTPNVDDVIEEMVAQGAGEFLNDEAFIEKVVNEDRSLAEKIIDFFRGIVNALRETSSQDNISSIAKALKENEERYQKALDTWTAALDRASENSRNGLEIDDSASNEESSAYTGVAPELADIETAANDPTNKNVIREGSNKDIRYALQMDEALNDKLRVNMATFFSGTGTVDFALRNIVNHEFAVEYDAKIAAVYKANNGDNIYIDDVRNVNIDSHKGKVEYFHASPVCKSYSNANNDQGEKPLDIETAQATADAIDTLQPKVVTVENVSKYKNSKAIKLIEGALLRNGYQFDKGVYRASDFGGATIRERMFLRAVKDGTLPEIDTSEYEPMSWYEAVEDLIPSLPKAELSNYMEERLDASGIDIDNLDGPIFILGGEKSGKLTWASANKPAPTILAKSTEAKIVMPDGKVLRATPRVMARIQGLPDEFDLKDSKGGLTNAYKVVGNGVPVQLTQGIVGPLLEENIVKQKSERTGVKYQLDLDDYDQNVESEGFNVNYILNESGNIAVAPNSYINDATWKKIHNAINKLGYGMPEVRFTKDYVLGGYPLQPDQSKAVKQIFGIEKAVVADTAEAEAKAKKYAQKAAKRFGTTNRFECAAYILVNGSLLDFSEGQGYRTMDHREISEILDLPDDAGYSDGMIEFMNQGNIRLQTYGADISKEPNAAQRRVLTRFIHSLDGEFTLDLSNENGDVIASVDYPEGTKTAKIFADIDRYFKDDIIPDSDDIMKFHSMYQLDIDDSNTGFESEAMFNDNQDIQSASETLGKILSEIDEMPSKKVIADTAYMLRKTTNTNVGVDQIKENLTSIFEYLTFNRSVDGADISHIVADFVGTLYDDGKATINPVEKEVYDEFRDKLRTYTFHMPSGFEGEIEKLGGIGALRREFFGTMNITKEKGIPIDKMWDELCDLYPEYFDRDIANPADQLESLVDTIRGLKPQPTTNELGGEDYDVLRYTVGQDVLKAFVQNSKNAEMREQYEKKLEKGLQKAKEKAKAQKERAKLKKLDRDARKRLLRKAQELSKMKGGPEFEAAKESLIGDLDVIAVGLRRDTRAKLEALQRQATEQAARDPEYKELYFDSAQEVFSRLSKRRIKDMTSQEVSELTDKIVELVYQQRAYTKMLNEQQGVMVATVGRRAMAQQAYAKGINEKNTIGATLGRVGLNMLNPTRAFQAIDGYQQGGVFGTLGKQLNDGQTRMNTFIMNANKKFNDFLDEHPDLVKTWSVADIDTGFKDDKGDPVMISKGMRISLYLHSLNRQNKNHIATAGIKIPNAKLYNKGKYDIAYRSSDANHTGYSTTVKLTTQQLKAIASQMTEDEKAFADLAHDFLNNDTKNAINEVSLILNGTYKAKVENYFPIKADTNFTMGDITGLVKDGTIEGMGMLKERQKGASVPILLEDVAQVLQRQINNTGKYYGLAVPIRDINKIMKFNENAGKRVGVRDAIESAWGKTGTKYITDVISQLQGGAPADNGPGAEIFNRLKSTYAGTVLNWNLGVAIKQSASAPFAAVVLDAKSVAKAMTMNAISKADYDYMDSITPWSYMRRQGMSGTEMGEVYRQKNPVENSKAWQKAKQKLNWIQGVDVWTTDRLFFATEYYVQDHFPDLEVRGEAYNKKVAELYNDMLQRTQPSYDVMQRNAYLRSGSALTKVMGMFKTQTFNMGGEVIDAWGRMQASKRMLKDNRISEDQAKAAKAQFGKTVGATVVSQMMLTMLGIVAKAVMHNMKNYRDDKGEVTPESVAARGMYEFLTSFAGMMIGGNEVQSIGLAMSGKEKWYDLEYPGLSVINDLISSSIDTMNSFRDAVESGWDPKKVDAFRKNAIKFSMNAAIGKRIPANNIYNIANMMNLWYQDYKNGKMWTWDAGEGLFGIRDSSVTKEQYARQAVDAVVSNNIGKAEYALGKTNKDQLGKAISVHVTDKMFEKYAEDPESMNDILSLGLKARESFESKISKANEDGSITDEEIRDVAMLMISEGLSSKDAYTLYLTRKADDKKAAEWVDGGHDFGKYLDGKKAMTEAQEFKDDEKREKVVGYIKSYSGSREEKELLWEMAGYKESSYNQYNDPKSEEYKKAVEAEKKKAENEKKKAEKAAEEKARGVTEQTKNLAKEIDAKIPEDTDKYLYVSQSTEYTPQEKVEWLKADSSRVEGKKYVAWKNVGGADFDYIKYRGDLSRYKGLPKKEKKAKVIDYIGNTNLSNDKKRVLWTFAGYETSTSPW